jgi:cytochrome c oxidase subunit 2
MRRTSTILLLAAGSVLVGCAADGNSTLQLSPAGQAGRELARTTGCAACHGLNGQGGTGPALVGLYNSTVTLQDGSRVTADDAYLTESIRNPDAKLVPGYSIAMPAYDLDDAELASILTYIRELADNSAPRP